MSQREYRIGPGAASLMLLVVVLSMCVLGVLALMGARSDEGLSLRSIQVAQEVARLNVQAERSLADLDEKLKAASETAANEAEYLEAVGALLEDGMVLDGNRISWQESDENGACSLAAWSLRRGAGTRVTAGWSIGSSPKKKRLTTPTGSAGMEHCRHGIDTDSAKDA